MSFYINCYYSHDHSYYLYTHYHYARKWQLRELFSSYDVAAVKVRQLEAAVVMCHNIIVLSQIKMYCSHCQYNMENL